MTGIITLIFLKLCLFTTCESEKTVEEYNVMVIDRNRDDDIENLKILHIMKMLDLKMKLPTKGDSMENILKNLTSIKSIKITRKENYIYLEEIKSQPSNDYTFKMKIFFKDNLYVSGVVTNSDGTW